jgi:hypothetical protein
LDVGRKSTTERDEAYRRVVGDKMKLRTLGIIRTQLGDYFIVPCGCEKELLPPQYKGVKISGLVGGIFPVPITVEFHTDYLFEEVRKEIEVADA